MIRIAVCDDAERSVQTAIKMIYEWSCDHEITVNGFTDGVSLIEAHSRNPFDIIFLDMVMPIMNGIDTALQIRKSDHSVRIVALTSSPEFAVDCFDIKASGYILKPIDKARFEASLNELSTDILESTKSITVKSLHAVHRIELRSIEFVEAQGKQVIFSLAGASTVTSTDPLYFFEDLLLPCDGFFKCHRSYIVNIARIAKYTSKEITMRSGSRIPISRSFHKEFEAAYFELTFGLAGDN